MADGMKKEDYTENCECGNPGAVPGGRIDIGRVTAKLDELQDEGDFAGAERLLGYWLAEAKSISDQVGEILIENEHVGFYRKRGQGPEALAHAERAVSLLKTYGMEDTVTAGSTWINAATACTAFAQPEKAMEMFEKARAAYEKRLPEDDGRLGGLYNNMGLCAAALKRYPEGRKLYSDALKVMGRVKNGESEAAITCLNLADLLNEEAGGGDEEALIKAAEETEQLVEKAWEMLNTPSLPRDAYYRFICGKCAPVFGHYGYLEYERLLKERA